MMSESRGAPFLDTSYIVRYLTQDVPEMAEEAAEVIDSDQEIVLSEVILAETAYVLASVYEYPRPELVDALMLFVQRRNIRMLKLPKELALEALRLCRDSKRHSFADALLWAEARNAGGSVYTFDRRFPMIGLSDPPAVD